MFSRHPVLSTTVLSTTVLSTTVLSTTAGVQHGRDPGPEPLFVKNRRV